MLEVKDYVILPLGVDGIILIEQILDGRFIVQLPEHGNQEIFLPGCIILKVLQDIHILPGQVTQADIGAGEPVIPALPTPIVKAVAVILGQADYIFTIGMPKFIPD